MARKNKYTKPDQVVLELCKAELQGLATYNKTLHNIKEVVRKAKIKGDTLYAEMVEKGISKYKDYKLNKELLELGYIDPEDMMSSQEWRDKVGL